MVLRVSFEDFPDAVRQYTGGKDAFLAELPSGAAATAGNPGTGVIVSAHSELPYAEAKAGLTRLGLKIHEGTWALEADDPVYGHDQIYFAAVAYRSRDIMPGLWMDAFPYEPSRADVLRAMYDEFIHTGEMKEVTFDEFVRSSFANVVILSPDHVKGFVTKKLAETG
jgi:hypothetical protein